MNRERKNIKEDMNINEEFLGLFSSDNKKKKKERVIRETINISDATNSIKPHNEIKKTDEQIIFEHTIKSNILDNINITIEREEIFTIRKVLNIIDKLKK